MSPILQRQGQLQRGMKRQLQRCMKERIRPSQHCCCSKTGTHLQRHLELLQPWPSPRRCHKSLLSRPPRQTGCCSQTNPMCYVSMCSADCRGAWPLQLADRQACIAQRQAQGLSLLHAFLLGAIHHLASPAPGSSGSYPSAASLAVRRGGGARAIDSFERRKNVRDCVVSIPFVWGGKEDNGVFNNALTWPCLTVLHGSVPLLEI